MFLYLSIFYSCKKSSFEQSSKCILGQDVDVFLYSVLSSLCIKIDDKSNRYILHYSIQRNRKRGIVFTNHACLPEHKEYANFHRYMSFARYPLHSTVCL